jgi:phospholipase/carboxylesterase
MTGGIHHITLITANVQANVDFYVGFLGLRLVKRTGGYEDPKQLHLFYGDQAGSPGSLLTFLVWEGGSPGRTGEGLLSEVGLAIDPASIGYWLERALKYQVKVEGTAQEFGETVLRLRDPDGVVLKLTGAMLPPLQRVEGSDIPPEHAIRRIRGATLLTTTPEQTSAFLIRYFGLTSSAREGTTERLVSELGDSVDVRDAAGFWPGAPGTGMADHLALRAVDAVQVRAVEAELAKRNSSLTNVHDREYFTSLYVREPGGILIELATDGPGFTLDEPIETLGSALFVPPNTTIPAQDIVALLPQFGLPGEERVIYRDLHFVHRFQTSQAPDGQTLVLLHGTGGDETDLMPLARRAAPDATLLGLRGRAVEDGVRRWFASMGPILVDQKDVRFEAEALEAFLEDAIAAYQLAPERMVGLGYSNGANLLAAMLLLRPGIIKRAVLLRPVLVVSELPETDLAGTEVLVVLGDKDAYRGKGEALAETLRSRGAQVTVETLAAGHALADKDPEAIADWLARDGA